MQYAGWTKKRYHSGRRVCEAFHNSEPFCAEYTRPVDDVGLNEPFPFKCEAQFQLRVKDDIHHAALEVRVSGVFSFDQELRQKEKMPNAFDDFLYVVDHIFAGSKKPRKCWVCMEGRSVTKSTQQIQFRLDGCSIKCDPLLVLGKHLLPEGENVEAVLINNR